MTKNEIATFVAAAIADGWKLSQAHEKSPVPAEQMGLLSLHHPHGPVRLQIEFSSLDKAVKYKHRFYDGREVERTYKAQRRMRGANERGHYFELPKVYDLAAIEAAAAAAVSDVNG